MSVNVWLWGNSDAGNTKGLLVHQQKSASFGDDFSNDQETLLPLCKSVRLNSEARRWTDPRLPLLTWPPFVRLGIFCQHSDLQFSLFSVLICDECLTSLMLSYPKDTNPSPSSRPCSKGTSQVTIPGRIQGFSHCVYIILTSLGFTGFRVGLFIFA